MAADGLVVFGALTAAGQDNGGQPAFAKLTVLSVGVAYNDAAGAPTYEVITALGASLGNFDGKGIPAFAVATAFGFSPPVNNPSFLAETATAIGLVGVLGAGQASFSILSAVAAGTSVRDGQGIPVFQAAFAGGQGYVATFGKASVVFPRMRAAAAGFGGSVAAGSASLSLVLVAGTGGPLPVGKGVVVVPMLAAYGAGDSAISATFQTWATNTRFNYVTQYLSYPYNSYARYNGTYLGAGPTGLFALDGADDAGTPIAWDFKTGQLDDKKPGLKRLVELLLGVRYDNPVTVTVWKNESESNAYALPNLRKSVLQQVRVKTGRGMRSRYYKVELSGTGNFELDSMQATMPETSRRIG